MNDKTKRSKDRKDNKRNEDSSSSNKKLSKKILINATEPEEIRVAFVEDGRLTDLDIDSNIHITKKSNIYKAVISRVEPSLNAVFVDYGSDKHGFLPFKEIDKAYFSEPLTKDNKDDIKSLLKEGQSLIVQVVKEERGSKGAALSTFIRLPGCFLVLMPNNSRSGGISRQIEGEQRQEMRELLEQIDLPKGMGVIVRTAGLGRTAEELSWDLSVLSTLWDSINSVASQKDEPFLIFQESDVIFRSVRDYLQRGLTEIIVDTRDAYDQVVKHVAQLRPDFTDKVTLYEDSRALFARFRLECQIELAYKREVDLLSGASIVIDQGEALTAIDVNSKKATAGSDIEETALNTNLEAADEIARQLKVRDLGGLIVIDFIDMLSSKNQRKVEQYLASLLKVDRARTQMAKISKFGLLEMSRQRLRPALSETLQHVCPQCKGHGLIRTLETFSLSMLRLLQEQLAKTQVSQMQFILPVEVATYLLNEKRSPIETLEEQYDVRILIIPNPDFKIPNYEFRRKRQISPGKPDKSYKIQQDQVKKYEYKARSIADNEEPAVGGYSLEGVPSPRPSTTSDGAKKTGLLKRLWGDFFGSNAADQSAVNLVARSQEVSNAVPDVDTAISSKGERSQRSGSANRYRSRGQRGRDDKDQRDNRRDRPDRSDRSDNRRDHSNRRSEGQTERPRQDSKQQDSKQRDSRRDTARVDSKDKADNEKDVVIGITKYEPKSEAKAALPKASVSKQVKAILAKYETPKGSKDSLEFIVTNPELVTAKLDKKIKCVAKEDKLLKPFDLAEVKARFEALQKVKLSFIETTEPVSKADAVMGIKYKKV